MRQVASRKSRSKKGKKYRRRAPFQQGARQGRMNQRKGASVSDQTFPFKIGEFQCMTVKDGDSAFSVRSFFVNVPEDRLHQVLRQHRIQPGEIRVPWICLYVNTGQHRLLVDTASRPGTAPGAGRLVPNLRAEGIEQADIDKVVLSHGHPDHIGGNTDDEGKAAFPNARYVMWKDEWEFWTSKEAVMEQLKVDRDTRRLMSAVAQRNLRRIQDRFDLIDSDSEIAPGVRAIAAPGHTPGHMAVAVSSAGEQLLHICDAVLSPVHLEHPEWRSLHDVLPEKATATRRRLLDWAAAEKLLVLTSHFPFPGLGHVIQKGKHWEWQPIEASC